LSRQSIIFDTIVLLIAFVDLTRVANAADGAIPAMRLIAHAGAVLREIAIPAHES